MSWPVKEMKRASINLAYEDAFWIFRVWPENDLQWEECALNPDGTVYYDIVASFGGAPAIVKKAIAAVKAAEEVAAGISGTGILTLSNPIAGPSLGRQHIKSNSWQ